MPMAKWMRQTDSGVALYPMTFFSLLLSTYNRRLDVFSKDLSPVRIEENKEQIEKVIAAYPEESLRLSQALLASLEEKGRDLMTSRFKDGKTLRQLAQENDVSYQRIYQLQNKYIRHLQSEKELMKASLVFFGLSNKELTAENKQQAVRQLLSNHGNQIAVYKSLDLNRLFDLKIETQDELNNYLKI